MSVLNFYSKSKHTGKIARKYVYMHTPNSLSGSLKEFKEFGEIIKYAFTDQIQLTFADHRVSATHADTIILRYC